MQIYDEDIDKVDFGLMENNNGNVIFFKDRFLLLNKEFLTHIIIEKPFFEKIKEEYVEKYGYTAFENKIVRKYNIILSKLLITAFFSSKEKDENISNMII